MKKSNLVLTLLLLVLTVFMFVSCDTNSTFMSSIINQADNFNTVSESYDTNQNNNIENIQLSAVTNISYSPEELTDTENLIGFNEGRLELISIHEEILIEVETIKTLFDSIKTKANSIKEKEYVLIEEDKDIITGNLSTLKDYKDGLLETRGEAYKRLFEQEYTRDNLEEILVMFDEVQDVLEYRLDTLRLAIIELENIDNILSDYMENWYEN